MKKLLFVVLLLTASCSQISQKESTYEYPPYKKSWPQVVPPHVETTVDETCEATIKPVAKPKRKTPKINRVKPHKAAVKQPIAQTIKAPEAINVDVSGMTLEEAYRFSGTERRAFASYPNTIPQEESAYLKQLFNLTDTLVIERNRNLKTGIFKTETQAATLEKIQHLNPPKELAEFHNKVVKAFKLQLIYYTSMKPEMKFNPANPLVQESHNELYGAYQLLMAKYSAQSDATKYTFFSHLQPACLI